MSLLNRTPEEIADICDRTVDKVPADEQVEAYRRLYYAFTQSGHYPAIAALVRRSGPPEGEIYEFLMRYARHHGHDEGLVFSAVYGL